MLLIYQLSVISSGQKSVGIQQAEYTICERLLFFQCFPIYFVCLWFSNINHRDFQIVALLIDKNRCFLYVWKYVSSVPFTKINCGNSVKRCNFSNLFIDSVGILIYQTLISYSKIICFYSCALSVQTIKINCT